LSSIIWVNAISKGKIFEEKKAKKNYEKNSHSSLFVELKLTQSNQRVHDARLARIKIFRREFSRESCGATLAGHQKSTVN
jgi:hypothetical protein